MAIDLLDASETIAPITPITDHSAPMPARKDIEFASFSADDDPRQVARPWNTALAARNAILIKNPITPPISPKINMGLRFHPFLSPPHCEHHSNYDYNCNNNSDDGIEFSA